MFQNYESSLNRKLQNLVWNGYFLRKEVVYKPPETKH